MASSLYKANAAFLLDSAAASTNATNITTASTDLFSLHCYNAAASVRYLKIYNTAVAPTVGTTVPFMVFAIGASATLNVNWAKGINLSTGLSFAMTTGAANSSTAALTAADVVALSIGYSL